MTRTILILSALGATSFLSSGCEAPSGRPPPDAVGLALSNITATNITSASAEIDWSSTVTATGMVQYGLTATYDQQTPLYGLSLDHRVPLSGLQPGTQYHYAVTSTDANQLSTSADQTFTTAGTCVACDAGGGSSGGHQVVGLAGKCLDAQGGTADGTRVDLWDCDGSAGQLWTLSAGQLIGPGGKCLDVRGNVSTPGTAVELWTCNGGPNQQWAFQGTQLIGIGGQCLDVTAISSANGTPIEIWGCNGGPNQAWAMAGVMSSPPPPPADGGTGTGAGSTTLDPNAFFVALGGSDGNDGSMGAPFASLEKAQTAMQSSSTRKTTYLRAGLYQRTQTLNLGSADNGETWSYYPPDGANSAVLDGAGAVDLIRSPGSQVSGVTVSGLKLQNAWDIALEFNGDDDTVENCDVGFNHDTSEVGSWPPLIAVSGRNIRVLNNFVHDALSQGIGAYAYNAGDSLDGTVISGNVVIRAVQGRNDGGAIYVDMHASNLSGGHVTITNNFVRDYGAANAQAEGIYLDDDSSNVTVSGNVIGPPSGSDPFNWGDTIINAGCSNTFSENIIDLGSSPSQWVGGWSAPGGGGSLFFTWNGPNVVENNIIISNYAGSVSTQNGHAYIQGSGYPSQFGMIQNNLYHNYGGGSEPTDGDTVSDASPLHADPQLSGWTYQLSSASPAFAALGFHVIAGGWGPPGFVIPQSGSAPSCPH